MHVENMKEEQLQQAMETIAEDPSNVTIIDNNGNDDNYNIKTEITEPGNNNNVQVRRSTRIKTTNPIIRLGNHIDICKKNSRDDNQPANGEPVGVNTSNGREKERRKGTERRSIIKHSPVGKRKNSKNTRN